MRSSFYVSVFGEIELDPNFILEAERKYGAHTVPLVTCWQDDPIQEPKWVSCVSSAMEKYAADKETRNLPLGPLLSLADIGLS